MNLEKLPSGRWRAVVSHGGVRRRTATFDTKAEARHAGAELTIELGGRPSRSGVTVGELLVGHVADARSRWSPAYTEDVERIIRKLPSSFADRRLRDIDPAVLTVTYRQLVAAGWSPHRVKRAHTVLSTAWADAITFGWASSNPCRDARVPATPPAQVRPPDDDDLAAVLAGGPPRLRLYLAVAACTGARRGEIVGLRWADLDLDRAEVTIRRSVTLTPKAGLVERPTKTGKRGHRVLALDSPVVAELRSWRAEQRERAIAEGLPRPVFVFSKDAGVSHWRPDYVTRAFSRACATVGVSGVRLHDVRHHVATSMLQDGEPLVDVAAQLGHASPVTTAAVYAHFMPGRGRESAERRAGRLRGGSAG